MGILKKVFKKTDKPERVAFSWKILQNSEQLNSIKNEEHKLSVLFKHSTRCIVSKVVLKEVEEKFKALDRQVDFYFLDLLNYRPISAAIAEQFDVEHQSPQVIVVFKGKVVAHESHYEIMSLDLEALIKTDENKS